MMICLLLINGPVSEATEKIVDRIMLPHSDAADGVFRWSEGSIVNLDGNQELVLLVSAFGHGGHDDTAANILEFHSADGGKSWTPLAEARVFQENIGQRNVMAPSLLHLDNGDLLCFFLVINSNRDGGPWMRRSRDNGATWSEPIKLPFTGYGGSANDRAIQLKSGRVVLPCWQSTDELGSTHSYCFYSDDRGETWNKSPLISTPPGSTGRGTNPAAEEPAVVELNDGRLLMFIRTYLGSIYRSDSTDGGATWSAAASTGIASPGSQVTLSRLPTGDILLIYNWAKPETIDGPWPRNYLTSAISKDEGKTFSFVRHLDGGADFPGKITMANVEIVGDNAVVMYSKSESKKNTYDWRLQVLPIAWFYEGDQRQVLGKTDDDASATSSSPRRIDSTHQLFVDDSLLASIDGLNRIVNQPVRHSGNPVLTYTEPWEGNCVITWGSVIYDEQQRMFKIWYESYKKFPQEGDNPTVLCFATSRDGINWEKPTLGQVVYRGSKENNIVFPPDDEYIDTATVMLNPKANGGDKYLMYYYSGRHKCICRAISTDGIRWTREDGCVVATGDRCTAGYDPARERYYIISRIPQHPVRSCGLWESSDGRQFDFVRELIAADERDPEKTELYGMIRFPYGNLQLGFLEMYYVPLRKLDTQLTYSRDGLHWHRAAGRQPFMPYGPPGTWEQTWVVPSQNPPIRIGDELFIFYQGRETLHWAEEPFGHIGSVGLAKLRVDGFVSLDTQNLAGYATTVPLILDGASLHINAKARPGSVAVEMLDENGSPIPGFERSDCIAFSNSDSTDHAIQWRNGKSLSDLANRAVQLRFYVQAAKLYSFWVE
jgi:hypothetical protein